MGPSGGHASPRGMREEQPIVPKTRGRRITKLQDVEPGAKLRLMGDAVGEVVTNPKDGYWILVRYVSFSNDPEREGTEDLVFVTDILEELESA